MLTGKKMNKKTLFIIACVTFSSITRAGTIELEVNEANCNKVKDLSQEAAEWIAMDLKIPLGSIHFIRPKPDRLSDKFFMCNVLVDTPKGMATYWALKIFSSNKGKTAFAGHVTRG